MLVSESVKDITVKQKNLAHALGVTPQAITKFVKDGIVIRDSESPGGAVYLFESLKRYFSRRKSGDSGIEAELDLTKERAKHERTKREIAELRLAKMEHQVYDARTVELVITEMLSNLRTQLLGLPSKLAPQLEGISKEQIYEIMTREIEDKLSELSGYEPELFTAEEIEDDDGDGGE